MNKQPDKTLEFPEILSDLTSGTPTITHRNSPAISPTSHTGGSSSDKDEQQSELKSASKWVKVDKVQISGFSRAWKIADFATSVYTVINYTVLFCGVPWHVRSYVMRR